MASLPPTATLQSVILHTLDSQGSIPDTRDLALVLPADSALPPAGSPSAQLVGSSVEAQNELKAVLASLESKEVRCPLPVSHPHLVLQLWAMRMLTPLEYAQMITFKQLNLDSHVLTSEGLSIAQQGSHEYLVWSALPPPTAEAGLTAKEIEAKVGKDTAKVGQGKAMKNKWVTKKGDGFLQAVRFSPCFPPLLPAAA